MRLIIRVRLITASCFARRYLKLHIDSCFQKFVLLPTKNVSFQHSSISPSLQLRFCQVGSQSFGLSGFAATHSFVSAAIFQTVQRARKASLRHTQRLILFFCDGERHDTSTKASDTGTRSPTSRGMQLFKPRPNNRLSMTEWLLMRWFRDPDLPT